MSRSEIGRLIGFILGFFCGRGNKKPSDGFNNTSNEQEKLSFISEYTEPNIKHPSDKQHRTNQERQWARENSISRAQKTMSFITTIAAIGAVVFAALTYCASLDTVRYTRIQAEQARRQADSASKPYILTRFKGSQSVYDWEHLSGSIAIDLQFTNYGQAPGTISSVRCGIFYGVTGSHSYDDQSSLSFNKPIATNMERIAVTIPNKESYIYHCSGAWPVNSTGYERARSKTVRERVILAETRGLFAISEFTYVTIEGKLVFQRACFEFNEAQGAGGFDDTALIPRQSDCNKANTYERLH